jgi:hypothetical protein
MVQSNGKGCVKFSLAFGLLAVTNELLELGIWAWYGDISQTYLYIIFEILFISEQLKCGDTADL